MDNYNANLTYSLTVKCTKKRGSRGSYRRCSVKKHVLKKFGKFHTKTPVLGFLFKKRLLQRWFL